MRCFILFKFIKKSACAHAIYPPFFKTNIKLFYIKAAQLAVAPPPVKTLKLLLFFLVLGKFDIVVNVLNVVKLV